MALKQVSPTDEFIKGLWRDNPVFIHMLGLCPALAVSNTAINALAMGAATTFVLLMAGLSVSLLRNFIPREARIVSYICIIATFVTCVDYAIMAISIELHRALGAFIALIVVNVVVYFGVQPIEIDAAWMNHSWLVTSLTTLPVPSGPQRMTRPMASRMGWTRSSVGSPPPAKMVSRAWIARAGL